MIIAVLARLRGWALGGLLAALALAAAFAGGSRRAARAAKAEAENRELEVEVRAQRAEAAAGKEVHGALEARLQVEEAADAAGSANVRAKARSRWTKR